ncbi:hypothetical protein JCGZ_00118 [Jatropha curcas]|uniref:Uncharacterized protein n=1 Tax=Jatropha curcas TaxID=180498 RepID=A0A067L417_JATCU|nr:hypothetical protein JCGZ_00118 [Jatropha curcas]
MDLGKAKDSNWVEKGKGVNNLGWYRPPGWQYRPTPNWYRPRLLEGLPSVSEMRWPVILRRWLVLLTRVFVPPPDPMMIRGCGMNGLMLSKSL